MIRARSKESKASSVSIDTKRRFLYLQRHISIKSNIYLPASPVVLFLIYAVCWDEVKSGRTDSSFLKKAFDKICCKEIDLQFLTYCLSQSYFLWVWLCSLSMWSA